MFAQYMAFKISFYGGSVTTTRHLTSETRVLSALIQLVLVQASLPPVTPLTHVAAVSFAS
jgi:hypothetical protein